MANCIVWNRRKNKLRNVVFMGTPDFAVGTLEALFASEYTVSAVFTQPDRPKGRHGILTPSPVKVAAQEHGVPVYQPARIRNPENLVFLRDLEPDVIVVVAFGQIIPEEILALPPYGCINVHASLLPKYRGAAPIQWSIIEGETHTGVTTMKMDAGLDTGDIILQEATPVFPDDTGGSLFERLSAMGAQLLLRTLRSLDDQTATFTKQPEQSPTRYASMLSRKDGEICWSKDAAALERLIRGLSPWPGAFTTLGGKQLKIWGSKIGYPETAPDQTAESAGQEKSGITTENAVPSAKTGAGEGGNGPEKEPGTVVRSSEGRLLVRTGSGILELTDLQMEGKKRMPADAFLRGYPVPEGTLLGR